MCLLPWSHEMCPLVCFVVSFRIFVLLWNQSVSVAKHPLHVRRSLPTQCLVWIDPQRCNLALMEKRPICILICIYIYICPYVSCIHVSTQSLYNPLTWCLMNSSFLWPQSTMISRGKVKDNISTYLLLLHWNVGKHLPLLSFWHILESSFPPPLNHGKDPWELPVDHFGSKHLVKLVKWRVREQCRPLGCSQCHPTGTPHRGKF